MSHPVLALCVLEIYGINDPITHASEQTGDNWIRITILRQLKGIHSILTTIVIECFFFADGPCHCG